MTNNAILEFLGFFVCLVAIASVFYFYCVGAIKEARVRLTPTNEQLQELKKLRTFYLELVTYFNGSDDYKAISNDRMHQIVELVKKVKTADDDLRLFLTLWHAGDLSNAQVVERITNLQATLST